MPGTLAAAHPNVLRVRDTFLQAGYDPGAIVANYQYAAQNGRTSLAEAALAAFAEPVPARFDVQRACIAYYTPGPAFSPALITARYAYLATPLILIDIDGAERVQVWPGRSGEWPGPLEPLATLTYDQLPGYFDEHAAALGPRALLDAKRHAYQTTLFDMDPSLLDAALAATHKLLVQRFAAALAHGKERAGTRIAEPALLRLALQLLAAAIVEDKLWADGPRSVSGAALLERATSAYPARFEAAAGSDAGIADVMAERLRRGATFRSCTVEMLGHFYAEALLSRAARQTAGIYYTTSSLSRRILEGLPVESLAPEGRSILDGTCGSGSLLIAGYDRLEALLPARRPAREKLAYLRSRIHGVDADPIAVFAADLSLFLRSLSAGPGGDAASAEPWDVREGNFLAEATDPRLGAPIGPTILVGNPPFGERSRAQRAVAFLERYLGLLPIGGLLGIVLPATFLENRSCAAARRGLLDRCELLDLWHLPEGAFAQSRVATAVLLARARPPGKGGDRPVRLGWWQPTPAGPAEGPTRVQPRQDLWLRNADAGMTTSPLDPAFWAALDSTRTLGQVAQVHNGVKRDGGTFSASRLAADDRPWLSTTDAIAWYGVWAERQPAAARYVRWPGTLKRPRARQGALLAGPKVLVNANRAPDSPWRIYAGIDRGSLFPSDGFTLIVPTDPDVTLEELAAILSSPIASAWVRSMTLARRIETGVMRGLPYPNLRPAQRSAIVGLVRRVLALQGELFQAGSPGELLAQIEGLAGRIDQLVLDAYAATPPARARLEALFAGYRRKWGSAPAPPAQAGGSAGATGRPWLVTGRVEGIDAAAGRATVRLDGHNDGGPLTGPIPPDMPGWALRPGVDFEAFLPFEDRWADRPAIERLTHFRLPALASLSHDALLGLLPSSE